MDTNNKVKITATIERSSKDKLTELMDINKKLTTKGIALDSIINYFYYCVKAMNEKVNGNDYRDLNKTAAKEIKPYAQIFIESTK